MKKVLAITLMLLLVATAAMAAENSWRITIKADNGVGGNPASGASLGVYPTGQEGYDSQDGTTSTSYYSGFGADSFGVAMHVAAVVPGAAQVFNKSIKAATMPAPEKTWDFYVAANYASTNSQIRLLAYTSSLLPTATFGGQPVQYFIRMLDNKGIEGAPANGTKWDLPIPTANVSTAYWTCPVNFPIIALTPSGTNQNMVAQGYKLQLVQAVVPEPSSLIALGTGLMGLAGLVSRRRRA